MNQIQSVSPEIASLLEKETRRQQKTINLIPSENYVSPAVRAALSSLAVNKYSEGRPGKRYYPGNNFIDQIEEICIIKSKQIFDLGDDWQSDVQPLSGSPANLAVYGGLLDPGDTILSMSLDAGGHLSHGHKVNLSARYYRFVYYGVDPKTGLIDYDQVAAVARKEKPRMVVCGATAYPRIIDFQKFGQIAESVGAYLLADISHLAGLISAGSHPSPFPYASVVMTTTHKTLRGPRSAVIYARKNIFRSVSRAVFPGLQGGPHQNVIAAKAVAFIEALRPEFKQYQKQIIKNAQSLAREMIKQGVPLVTGGTDNHLLLANLKNIIAADQAQDILEEAGILANRNAIPGDESYLYPSGLRMGTPAVTTRGMKEKEMVLIAEWTATLIKKQKTPAEVRSSVERLCQEFPIF